MKKNWLPIALILVFIVIYDLTVVRRFSRKATETPQSAQTNAPAAPAATTAAPAASTPTLTAVGSDYKAPDAAVLSKAQPLSLGNGTQLSLFGNGSFGLAELENFFVRGKKGAPKQNVQLLPNSLQWLSSQNAVANCLAAMKQAGSNTFEAKNAEGSCRLSFAPHATQSGLVSASLVLNGFSASLANGGYIELRGREPLGEVEELDQNYLAYKQAGETHRVRGKKIYEATKSSSGRLEWLSWGDKYFTTLFLPKGNFNPDVVHGPTNIPVAEGKPKEAEFALRYPLVANGGAVSGNYEFDLYVGALDQDKLESIRPGLSEVIDFGWMATVAKAMVWLLKLINALFHNFGVSIIILTLLVRLAFWPLNKKAYLAAQRMKNIQPLTKALQEKYGNDPSKREQLNMEMLNLYKREKVNPLGSCLPLLLQMPVFIGLYAALSHSLDLYQAPFMGWITDLSSRDPYYVFPVLWTLSLFVYVLLNPQTMTPQPGMPDMRWMTYGMNLFIGFLSKDWPAGLTLYLFVSNLVGIAQQLVMRRAEKLQPVQEGV